MTPCIDCGEPVPDGDGCTHRDGPWCYSCGLARCAECASDAADDHAAEMTADVVPW